jgi:ATP-dependent phosphofructokinase / diphosphate-dependent phosphofructokinase
LSTPKNLIIGQSGGATAVINASLVGAIEAAMADARIDGIYGMHYGIEGFLKEDLFDLRRQPADLWPALMHTPSAALGTCRYKLQENDPNRAVELLRKYNIR